MSHGTHNAAAATTGTKRRRRRILIALLGCLLAFIVGLMAWWGFLWRSVPRAQHFGPVLGSITEEPLADPFQWPDSPSPEALAKRAEAVLKRPLQSLLEKPYQAPSGDPRDYTSLSIYWWPNPIMRLPYIHRDGRRNPEASKYDAPRLRQAIDTISTLAEAHAATGDGRFAERAREQLSVWFVTPDSRMNPHLTFAQMMPGWAAGGRQGIIEGLPLVRKLPRALALLETKGQLSPAERRACREWLGSYLAWLLESCPGRAEKSRRNNHGTWYDVQVAGLAVALGLDDLAEETLRDSRRRMEYQFLADGQQPEELRRRNSLDYSIYNLDAWLHLARLGQRQGIEIWTHRNSLGGGPGKALQYLEKHVANWSHPQLSSPPRDGVARLRRRANALATGK